MCACVASPFAGEAGRSPDEGYLATPLTRICNARRSLANSYSLALKGRGENR